MNYLKRCSFFIPFSCSLLMVLIVSNCKQDEVQTIVVKTLEPAISNTLTPTIEGEIISNDGLPITKRGVCFSTLANPTLIDGHMLSSSTTNSFSVQVTNLNSNKKYYFRAFVVSGSMIFYGNEVTCRTESVWKQVADFGGVARFFAVGFAVGDRGYVGVGHTGELPLKDFWEYHPTSNTWTQRADYAGGERLGAFYFSIDTRGYVGTGWSGGSASSTDFWEYNPTTNEWIKKADDIGTIGRTAASSFVINGKGYVGTGDWGGYTRNFWEYSPISNTWTQIATFGGTARTEAVAFAINGKGYVGTGQESNGYYRKDFWEYNPNTNIWTQKADFSGTARASAVGFAIGNKGYIGGGGTFNNPNWTFYSDFWEYNPTSNSWRQIENFRGGVRFLPVAFVIGNKAYVGTGSSSSAPVKDFWEFTPQ